MRKVFFAISTPILLFLEIINILYKSKIREDIIACEFLISSCGVELPLLYIKFLVCAEDRRFFLHPGVDFIAILRALWVRVLYGKQQGASTIEQQLVRLITGRYERTFRRKLREQVISIYVSRNFEKEKIANAYLCQAYYGSGLLGVKAIEKINGRNFHSHSPEQVALLIARLKYPEPRKVNDRWNKNVYNRSSHILREFEINQVRRTFFLGVTRFFGNF